jgi:hypothetical protein
MSEIFTYRIDLFETEPLDLTGFDVEATDGRIGTIDEASLEAGASWLVVDTGFWIFGKKRMIPAGVVESVDAENGTVRVSMTKHEIKDAPDFDAERHAAEPGTHHTEYGPYYERFGPQL